MTLKQAYSYAVQFLEGNNIDEADFKALCIACDIAGIKNSQYIAHQNDDIIMSRLADKLWKLKSGEPLQYVIGKWDFYNSTFYVGDGVLIPRPETEELCAKAIEHIKHLNNCVVYDLCAGSGCIGASIAKECPNAQVYLVEKSEKAMEYLNKNISKLDNAHAVLGDIFNDPLSFELPKCDVLVSNPPYIKSDDIKGLQSEVLKEPPMALDGGKDGLDFYRIINDNWCCMINGGGVAFFEIGNEQGESVPALMTRFNTTSVIKDIYGNDRIVIANK